MLYVLLCYAIITGERGQKLKAVDLRHDYDGLTSWLCSHYGKPRVKSKNLLKALPSSTPPADSSVFSGPWLITTDHWKYGGSLEILATVSFQQSYRLHFSCKDQGFISIYNLKSVDQGFISIYNLKCEDQGLISIYNLKCKDQGLVLIYSLKCEDQA